MRHNSYIQKAVWNRQQQPLMIGALSNEADDNRDRLFPRTSVIQVRALMRLGNG